MEYIIYKVHLPFGFFTGKTYFNDALTIRKFKINNMEIELREQADKIGTIKMYAFIKINETNLNEDIVDNIVGTTLQKFLDGLTKALDNIGFFEIYNGDMFISDYEVIRGAAHTITPYNGNKGYNLHDNLIKKAIEFSNEKEDFLYRAWYYLKEAEYFVEIGRIESSIIQLAIMTEQLINYVLKQRGYLNKKGELKDSYYEEAKQLYKKETGISGSPSFVFRKYYYGLLKLNYSLDKDMQNDIGFIYDLRNWLAHGEELYKNEVIIQNGINKINIYDYMVEIINRMEKVYNFFLDNFKE